MVQREGLPKDAENGDRLRIKKKEETYEGILMPTHRFSDEDIVTLKLDNGYNVGIKVEEKTEFELVKKGEKKTGEKEKKIEKDENKPKISILGTGGTIASYVEYRTGAVHPAQTADELLFSNPEIAERCDPNVEVLFSKLSEDMRPEDWISIADRVTELFQEGAKGVVVSHGTDTMGYTAAALSFLLEGLSKPVVLVGSQRSSDRPSSDAHLNLLGAVEVAKSGNPGVYVVMHDSISDEKCAVHKGTKVRKMHTSRRDAFTSINDEPVGFVDPETGEVDLEERSKREEDEEGARRKGSVEKNVSLLYANPGLTEDDIKHAGNKEGIVIAGTGLGHMSTDLIPALEEVIDKGVPVVMTSQCFYGTVNGHVYSAGRELKETGVIFAGDMLPETAMVKLMWALTLDEDVEKVMKRDIAGEYTERRVR
ncbi:MAG: Glu-tRNA(Gln) amidotransferase subunit GatD [Candidatus Thermoplasmatota archaeon]